ncbi:hypothetical protein RJ639_016192 [Escallonia herrerae]|uniref:CRM domain-containing protein n=1 Tax=Escallonia herrerae TaxID=1293975 RepID=A0AA89AND7_9ASTE|nr:hypothetical protein RJ639_016192 [Escallonia herrerae]
MHTLPLSPFFPPALCRIFRPPPPPTRLLCNLLFNQPQVHSIPLHVHTTRLPTSFPPLSSRSLYFRAPSLCLSLAPHSLSSSNSGTLASVETESEIESEDFEPENDAVSDRSEGVSSSSSAAHKELLLKLPSLSVKEKKELASYAHSLGKKLKSQQVGKSGVTDSVATALVETLESNELLKLKIHGNCPGELDDVVKRLEETTGSVVVGRIGRTVILYRPSLTKLMAEEKKRQARRVFVRKQAAFRPSILQKAQNAGGASRASSRGPRSRSRF